MRSSPFMSVDILISHAITSEHFVVGCASVMSPNDVSENYCNCSYNANPTAVAIFLQGKNIIIQYSQGRERIGALHFPKKGSSKRTEPLHLVWSAAIVCTCFPLLLVSEGKVEEPDNAYIARNSCRPRGMKTAIAKNNKSGGLIHCLWQLQQCLQH